MIGRSLLIVGNRKTNGTPTAIPELRAMEGQAVRHPRLDLSGPSLTAGSFVPIVDAAARCDRASAITRGRRSEAPPQQATGS